MLKPSNLLLSILFIGLFSCVAFAQSNPPFSRLSNPTGYSSPTGRFAILLPPNPDAQRRITPADGTNGGMQFFWRTADGEFFVTYYDSLTKPENPRQELEALRETYLSGTVKNGGKLLEKKDLTLGKNIGLELKAGLKSKETVIIRYYLVGKRIYILSTRLNANETGETQLKTLNTFKVLTK